MLFSFFFFRTIAWFGCRRCCCYCFFFVKIILCAIRIDPKKGKPNPILCWLWVQKRLSVIARATDGFDIPDINYIFNGFFSLSVVNPFAEERKNTHNFFARIGEWVSVTVTHLSAANDFDLAANGVIAYARKKDEYMWNIAYTKRFRLYLTNAPAINDWHVDWLDEYVLLSFQFNSIRAQLHHPLWNVSAIWI